MKKDKYNRVVWFNLLKDFGIAFGVGLIVTYFSNNEFLGTQITYICLLIGTLISTINIYQKMEEGGETGIPFLPLNIAHKIILFCTLLMGTASVSVIPMAFKENNSDNSNAVLMLVILVLIGSVIFFKWWGKRADEFNQNRIQRYIKEEMPQIQKIVDYLLVNASEELLFEVLKDRVNYDCVFDANYKINSCKILYLWDLGIDELQEPLRFSAYKIACHEKYQSQKWG